jgi:hypothetical protein
VKRRRGGEYCQGTYNRGTGFGRPQALAKKHYVNMVNGNTGDEYDMLGDYANNILFKWGAYSKIGGDTSKNMGFSLPLTECVCTC